MAPQNLDSFLLGSSNLRLAPTARSSAVSVLHEKMAAADLPLALADTVRPTCGAAVVVCHVDFKGFGVRARGRFPARLFNRRVEVVREVLGVGVADLPSGWKTCLYLYQAP